MEGIDGFGKSLRHCLEDGLGLRQGLEAWERKGWLGLKHGGEGWLVLVPNKQKKRYSVRLEKQIQISKTNLSHFLAPLRNERRF